MESRLTKKRYTCLETVGPAMRGCGLVFGSWEDLKEHEKTHIKQQTGWTSIVGYHPPEGVPVLFRYVDSADSWEWRRAVEPKAPPREWIEDYAGLLRLAVSLPNPKPQDWEAANNRLTEVTLYLRAAENREASR